MSRVEASLIAFLVTLMLLLALRPLASAIGLVDHPGGRKTHTEAVPVIGGLCMYLGLLIVFPRPGRTALSSCKNTENCRKNACFCA